MLPLKLLPKQLLHVSKLISGKGYWIVRDVRVAVLNG